MDESTAPSDQAEPDRKCTRCGELKPATDFHWSTSGKGIRRRRAQCCDCRAVTRGCRTGERKSPKKKYPRYPRKPETAEENRRAKLRSYGITEEHYQAMLAEQGGGCAICGAPYGDTSMRRLAVDHCHQSGRVRALLCSRCNRALGSYEAIREQAAKYLTRYGAGNPLLAYEARE